MYEIDIHEFIEIYFESLWYTYRLPNLVLADFSCVSLL
jgi:hypothetical protein